MSEKTFENATVDARVNVYYDGGVVSRDITTANEERMTLGIMQPGKYDFETESKEMIEIYAGSLVATVPSLGEDTYDAGSTFTVPAETTFSVTVEEFVEYGCLYGSP